MQTLRLLALLALILSGLAACGDDGPSSDAGQEDSGACYDPCIAKGGTDQECSLFCNSLDDGKGEPLPSLPTNGSPGTYAVSFEHDDVTREAVVYVPASYSSDDAPPLLLNFHGFGGTAQDHMAEADMRPEADDDGFLLVYPQGSLLDGQPHWNSAAPSADNKSDADDLGYVDKLLDTIASSHTFDANRVYAVGYSNGAMMAFGLACYRSERIAAVGSVSGAMLDDIGVACTPSHPTSVITFHGTDDDVIAYNGGDFGRSAEEVVAYWTELNEITGAPTTDSTSAGGTQVDSFVHTGGRAGTEVHHHRVVGGEHVWFELEVKGANTGRLIWEFVSRFSRDGAF